MSAPNFEIAPAKLSEAYLSILGYGVTTETKARRHLKSISLALAEPLPAGIIVSLEEKKRTIEARWGSLTEDGRFRNDLKIIAPEDWLRTRMKKEQTFGTLRVAATQLMEGCTNIGLIHVESFGLGKPKRLLVPVGVETFTLWLKRTGIVRLGRERGVCLPGPNTIMIRDMPWCAMKLAIDAQGDD